ncbi:MAG TPA: FAD-binding protein [Pyrinomonadaceae bacterium]|jgi:glycolate oxidase subunit GlcD|nr:FAD-binding protein [Pyrinomonadaceae bacterium]
MQNLLDPIIEELRAVVGETAVLSEPDELLVYECDGLPQHKYLPRAVVFPSSTEATSAVMRVLAAHNAPFTSRGAGTGLSGGALALNRGVVVSLARMRKILNIDAANRIAVVQPGVVNSHVSRAVAQFGLHYVPDPSSQPTCTIGGNIAENAGGIHCLKYGTTTDHVLGLRVVLAGGEIVDLGGGGSEATGYDLLGAFVGSEGTFGIVTEATLRLVPIPPAVRTLLAEFAEVNAASHAVSAIIAAGVMPAALEMMDHEIIRAVEQSVFAAGLPLDAGAALLIELDGLEAGIDDEAAQVKSICMKNGARDCRLARDENERKKLWAARKGAFGAIGRIAPDSMIQDAVVPRSRLPEILDGVFRIAEKYQLRIANVFHAGDGNLHPLICFDSRSADEVLRVKEAGRELMETCVRAGGSITGEHGVGFDKRELLSLVFSDADMDAMLRVRAAFDPTGLCNPGKIIPMLRGCGEARAVTKTKDQGPTNVLSEPTTTLTATSDLLGPRAPRPHRSANPILRNFDPPNARQQLVTLVGEDNVSALPCTPLVVYPGSIAEVCEVMKLASSGGWSILPAGGMSWLGARQDKTQLIVSTQRLNQIIEHEPADLIAVTEAGASLDAFNEKLQQNGQWLPLDPPDDGHATVGGVVATGLGGAQQFGYGAPRRHVIGMKVVLADGTLIKVGGRVVKNVAGYDLCKLFTGSYGTLGILAEVNFKLRPVPQQTGSIVVLGQREPLLNGARQVIESRLFPVAAELLSPALGNEMELSEGREHVLLLRFAGSSGAVTAQLDKARELVRDREGNQARVLIDDRAVWKSLASVPMRITADSVWRVGVRPNDLPSFLMELDKLSSQNGPATGLWQAGIGDGRIRVMNQPRNENAFGETKKNSMDHDSLRSLAKNFGATLIVEYGDSKMQDQTSTTGAYGIMHRIKQQLDPDHVLPSRVLF